MKCKVFRFCPDLQTALRLRAKIKTVSCVRFVRIFCVDEAKLKEVIEVDGEWSEKKPNQNISDEE